MRKITRFTFSILSFASSISFSVGQVNNDNLLWNETHKLTVDDFGIKTNSLETSPSYVQFSFDYQINGYDFMTKNFNKKVRNFIIRTASWIDTTTNVSQSLLYQQTVFDISEIYARQFRKSLRENRKQITYGKQIVEELNNKIMTEFSKRRIDYDRETSFGADITKQREWEMQIQKELLSLDDFAYDK